jgi:hypothetical protein
MKVIHPFSLFQRKHLFSSNKPTGFDKIERCEDIKDTTYYLLAHVKTLFLLGGPGPLSVCKDFYLESIVFKPEAFTIGLKSGFPDRGSQVPI